MKNIADKMKNLNILYIVFISLILSSCECHFIYSDPDLCEWQTVEYTVTDDLIFTYEINTNGNFLEAHRIDSDDVFDAFGESVSDEAEIKKIELVGASFAYSSYSDNEAEKISFQAFVAENDLELLLMNETGEFDIPDGLGESFAANALLNTVGVTKMKELVRDYAGLLNFGSFDVLALGTTLPQGKLCHVQLDIAMRFTMVYEDCRWLPLGMGDETCEG
ncbi:MAG TPA: hypothetical protein VJ917_07125 [Saprospiraceae bacterium]|nr:hypothetical protein [Saprospiraceae bacterium]